jgi:plastocyanin
MNRMTARRWLRAIATIGAAATIFSIGLVSNSRVGRADDNGEGAHRTVQFGLEGSEFDPAGPAGGGSTRDRNRPGALVVKSGTTVTFENFGAPHRIALYDAGLTKNGSGPTTTFADIVATAGAGTFLDDPAGRLAVEAAGADLTYEFTNTSGGVKQYLAICAFRPHFTNYGQATFILVRPE